MVDNYNVHTKVTVDASDLAKLPKTVSTNTKAFKQLDTQIDATKNSLKQFAVQTKRTQQEQFKAILTGKRVTANARKQIMANKDQVNVVKKLEATIKRFHSLQVAGITLNKRSNAELAKASVAYTLMGGSIKKLTAGNALSNLLGLFTKLRWALVNVSLGYMLISRAVVPIIKANLDLQTEMANVKKTTGFTTEQIKEMRHEFVLLSKDIPVAASELAKIGAVGGQLGLGDQGAGAMTAFVRASSMLATATGMSAEDAATNLAKISQSFNLPISNAMKLGSVLNELENTTAATAEEIAESLKRVGAAGANLGLSIEFVAALEATLISAGMKGSRAGTRIRNALNTMSSETEKVANISGKTFQQFSKDIDENAVMALTDLIKHLDSVKDEVGASGDIISTFGKVGGFGIQTLVSNYSELSDNIETANNEMRAGLSLVRETGTMAETTAKQWELLKNSVAAATVERGGFLNKMIQGARSFQLIKEHTGEGILSQVGKDIAGLATTGGLSSLLGGFGRKENKEIFAGQIQTLIDLGNQAGLTAKDFEVMFDDIGEFAKKSSTLAISQADNYISTLNDNIASEDARKEAISRSAEELGGFTGALEKYVAASTLAEESTKGTLDDFMDSSMALEDLKEKIRDTFGDEVLSLIMKYASGVEKSADATVDLALAQKRAALAFNITNKSMSEQLKTLKEEYKDLKTVRFTGEKESLANIHQIELAIKRERLAQIGLTYAVEETNDALKDNKNTYEAWQLTVEQFITSAVRAGNLLGQNVTSAVKKYQTLLLSTSKFASEKAIQGSLEEEKTALQLLEEERLKAQLEYDIGIGEQHHALSDYINELENENRLVVDSAEIVKDSLGKKKKEIDELTDKQEGMNDLWKDAQNAVKMYELDMDSTTFSVLDNLKDQKDSVEELIQAYRTLNTTSGNKKSSSGGGSKVGWQPGDGPISLARPNMSTEDGPIFVPLLANGGIITKPTLALMGEAGPEMVVPLSGPNAGAGLGQSITIGEISVSGVSGDASDFAYRFAEELRRELRTL